MNGVRSQVLELAYENAEMASGLQLLDRLGSAITEVTVVGQVEEETRRQQRATDTSSVGATVGFSPAPSMAFHAGAGGSTTTASEIRSRQTGVETHRVHFGNVAATLEALAEKLNGPRVWVLLDEWSEIPVELQPLLADLINRALFPVRGYIVKIAAIPHRSSFRVARPDGGYLGIEVGAAAADDVELDDYMVFGNDEEKAKDFFGELLFRHVKAEAEERGEQPVAASADALRRETFTQHNAFDEFVRAAEGVPRDGINVILIAAQRADDAKISVDHVRGAARDWYLRNKEKSVSANPAARALLHWIIDEVIGERRARAFLLEQGEAEAHPLIAALHDARVLHVIKRGVSTHDRPGVRYDVYALDYGCYVELMTTAKAPLGLFEVEDESGESFAEVPRDDYRSIRRAILEIDEFEQSLGPQRPSRAVD